MRERHYRCKVPIFRDKLGHAFPMELLLGTLNSDKDVLLITILDDKVCTPPVRPVEASLMHLEFPGAHRVRTSLQLATFSVWPRTKLNPPYAQGQLEVNAITGRLIVPADSQQSRPGSLARCQVTLSHAASSATLRLSFPAVAACPIP